MLESISEESMPAGATVSAAESNHGDVLGAPASATGSTMALESVDGMRARLTMENDDFRVMSRAAQDIVMAMLCKEQARLRAAVLAGPGDRTQEVMGPLAILRLLGLALWGYREVLLRGP